MRVLHQLRLKNDCADAAQRAAEFAARSCTPREQLQIFSSMCFTFGFRRELLEAVQSLLRRGALEKSRPNTYLYAEFLIALILSGQVTEQQYLDFLDFSANNAHREFYHLKYDYIHRLLLGLSYAWYVPGSCRTAPPTGRAAH